MDPSIRIECHPFIGSAIRSFPHSRHLSSDLPFLSASSPLLITSSTSIVTLPYPVWSRPHFPRRCSFYFVFRAADPTFSAPTLIHRQHTADLCFRSPDPFRFPSGRPAISSPSSITEGTAPSSSKWPFPKRRAPKRLALPPNLLRPSRAEVHPRAVSQRRIGGKVSRKHKQVYLT